MLPFKSLFALKQLLPFHLANYSAMQPSENTAFFSHHLLPSNPNQYHHHHHPTHFPFQLSRGLSNNPLYNNPQITPQFQHFNSSSSTSDEEQQQMSLIINQRIQRRMISNRESARRSRVRKQKHLDELWTQVNFLQTENHQLIDKLSRVADSHDRVVHENVQLKEEASQLRQILTSPYPGL